ncbi:MAG: hypothetical protein K8R46_00080 [Pirellulales bacterium]|nr:hypothetical protein [Pirellulales bacterium]
MLKLFNPRFVALVGSVLLVVIGLAGCRDDKVKRPIPKTYPVTGKVVTQHGKLPPAGSLIQFQPDNAEYIAQDNLGEDGSFSLMTLFDGQRLPGATAGPHRVELFTIVLGPNNSTGPGELIVIKGQFTVEPKENRFIIDLDSQASR